MLLLVWFIAVSLCYAQAPNISYSSPPIYYPFVTITYLTPTNTGGAVPGTTSAIVTTLTQPVAYVTIDASENIYVNAGTVIYKIVGNFTTTFATGITVTGMAVDAAGNVFVSDNVNKQVKEFPAAGGSPTILASVTAPYGLTLDAQDNVYVCSGSAILKIPAGGGTPVPYASGFSTPFGLTFDASGNLYVADHGANLVIKVSASDGTRTTLANGSGAVTDVAVDPAGDVFYSDSDAPNIMVVPTGSTDAFGIGPAQPGHRSLAVDKFGNVFTANGGRAVYEIPFGFYAVSPRLPAGLMLDHAVGIISGMPLMVTPAANYNVTAFNSQGSSTATINITVNAATKPNISYSTPQSYNVGTPVSITPSNTGGPVPGQYFATLASGLSATATGLAIDRSGNIYSANGSTSIVKRPPGGGSFTNIGSFNDGAGVAVDASGNVFVAAVGDKAIKEVMASNGSTITYATGFSSPLGVAIDASGNLYVSDVAKNAILKVPAGGGVASVLVSGLNSPAGVAVDPAGNVYFANKGENTVREIPSGSSSTIVLASGFNGPYGVAVDPAGNVFVADKGNAAIKRIPAGGGAPTAIAPAVPLKQPGAIALDASGDIYLSDWTNTAIYETDPGFFVNPTFPAGLSIDEGSGVISGTPTAVSAKTNYTISTRNSGGVSVATVEITINPYQLPSVSYTSPQVYATNVAITPLVPKGGNVFRPTYQRTVTSFTYGLTGNQGIAVDNAGNVYVAETGNTQIIKIAPDGVTTTNLGSGFSSPEAVAVDQAGNVYVADYGNHAVKEITTGGAVLSLGSGFTNPESVAVDLAGNVYVADYGNGIKKIPAGNGTPVNIAPADYNTANTIAVDGYGNVFFAYDVGNIFEISAANGAITPFSTYGVYTSNSVAIDATGNIYYCGPIGNGSGLGVYEYEASDYGAWGALLSFGGTQLVKDKLYLAADGKGVLYMSDPTTGTITKGIPQGGYFASQFVPAGLTINPNTGVIGGTPAAPSPATNYTVTGYNPGGSGAGTVNISVVGATNTSLSGLAISQGTLRPAFATATKSYAITEASTVSSITLTPTTSTTTATVLINGEAVASGTASAPIPLVVGPNTIQVAVTDNGGNSVSNYMLAVTRTGNPILASLSVSPGTLSPAFNTTVTSYTTTLPAGVTSISVTPTLVDSTGTVTVNGKQLATGTASPNIQLSLGANTISVVTTSADGSNTKTYTITATRPSANDNLSYLSLSTGSLSPAFNANTLSYTSTVANTVTSATVKPTTADANATVTVTVNGTAVTSGTNSSSISLGVGVNTINVKVIAQDGSTTKTYSIKVTRAASSNANLSAFKISPGVLTPAFSSTTTSYTASVVNGVTSITVTPTAAASTATITVNGTPVASGTASGSIALAVGSNTITTIATAPDGVTTKTYTLTVTRASGGADSFDPGISVSTPIAIGAEETPALDDIIVVHQGVSPNGDGINDFLVIDGIQAYPDNNLAIMNRSGQLIFEAKGYDNTSKVFDGHSNKNGQMQLPGTYFYQLDYTVGGIIKHKTGFIVLKY